MAKVKVKPRDPNAILDYGPNYRHYTYKPQNIADPVKTNQHLVKYGTSNSIKGRIALINKKSSPKGRYDEDIKRIRRKHAFEEEARIRDEVIAHTPEGKRIFAFNDYGYPICYSNKNRNNRTNEDDRCQSTMTYMNGRCIKHGGKAPSGVMHYNSKHLRSGDSLPQHLQNDLRRAERDPDLLNLSHEIHLTDLREKRLKMDLEHSRSESALRRVDSMLRMFSSMLQKGKHISDDQITELIAIWVEGKDEKATHREISLVAEVRRKLVETAAKREEQLNLMMKADQVMNLVTAIAACAKECVGRHILNLEKHYFFLSRKDVSPELEEFLLKQNIKLISLLEPSWKMDFLSDIGIKLRKMVSGASRPGSVTPDIEEDKD